MQPHQTARTPNRLLEAMTEEDRQAVRKHSEVVQFGRGDVLQEAGEPVSHVYFLRHGVCSVVANAPDGNRIESAVIGREGMIGLSAVLGTGMTSDACLALVDGEAVRLRADLLSGMLVTNPSMLTLLLRYTQVSLVQISQTALANGRYSIERRLARWILMCHDRIDADEMHFTHDLLAMMLGVRRPGVTVATHVLEGVRAIKASRGRIRVLDRDVLQEMAAGSYGVPEAEYERLIGPFRQARGTAPIAAPILRAHDGAARGSGAALPLH